MYALAISKFDIPGESSFPLNSVYAKPQNATEAGKSPLIDLTFKLYALICMVSKKSGDTSIFFMCWCKTTQLVTCL